MYPSTLSFYAVIGAFAGLASLVIPAPTFADTTASYTAGNICVARTARENALLDRNANGSLENLSETTVAIVHCSTPTVDNTEYTAVRLVVYAKQGDTEEAFGGAFGFYNPRTGIRFSSVGGIAPNLKNKFVKFVPKRALPPPNRGAYNFIQVRIPPKSSIISIHALYSGGAAQSRSEAFALADKPTTASYNPPAAQTYNSAGKINSIRRRSTGRYEVSFPGVGGKPSNVQVTSHGAAVTHCKVARWGGTTNVVVTVACFDAQGQPADSRFTVSYKGL